MTPETRSIPSVPTADAAAARSSASGAVPKAQGTAPAWRTWRASRRVSTPVKAGTPWRTQEGLEALGRPPVRRLAGEVAHDDAAAVRDGGLVVGRVRAVVADVRAGEGDHLAGVGRVGDHLLIAAHGRVEDELARGDGHGAPAASPAKTAPSAVTRRARGRSVAAGVESRAHRCATASITTGSPRNTVWRTAPWNVRPA